MFLVCLINLVEFASIILVKKIIGPLILLLGMGEVMASFKALTCLSACPPGSSID
jgi:hypothetical protein